MIDYLFAGGTLIAAIHAFSYGMWLRQNGNKKAFYGVMIIVMVGLGISGYRLIAP